MLRDLQKNRIKKLLSINEPWKILIIDKRTQKILSPILKLKDLNDCGVTSCFSISQKRNPISNTPAIYFVSDIKEIHKDILNGLYSGYHINSLTYIRRKELEKLSYELSSKSLALSVRSVFDQFLDFVSLQDDLYSFEMEESYIYKDTPDIWHRIVNSLMSVFVTLNGVPFIFNDGCQTTNGLSKMLSDKIKGLNIIGKSTKRPVLILLDRDFDIITPIQHVWSYSALIDDLLDFQSNKVKFKDKVFDLDPSDPLWIHNRNEYFPLVVERIEHEMTEYKKEMALRSIDSKSDKKKIQDALDKAPELAKKNESVNAHISICLEMVDIIKKRSIDDFYTIEKGEYKNQDLMEISDKGNDDDILRLALTLLNTKDADLVQGILEKRKIKSKVVNYFKNYTSKNNVQQSTLFSNVVSGLMGNIKKLLPVKERSPLSDLVEVIYNNIKSQNFSKSNILDPYNVNNIFSTEVSSIVVCCIGGATYSELKTLKILEERIRVPIIYGGTEILNARRFLDQVEKVVE